MASAVKQSEHFHIPFTQDVDIFKSYGAPYSSISSYILLRSHTCNGI